MLRNGADTFMDANYSYWQNLDGSMDYWRKLELLEFYFCIAFNDDTCRLKKAPVGLEMNCKYGCFKFYSRNDMIKYIMPKFAIPGEIFASFFSVIEDNNDLIRELLKTTPMLI